MAHPVWTETNTWNLPFNARVTMLQKPVLNMYGLVNAPVAVLGINESAQQYNSALPPPYDSPTPGSACSSGPFNKDGIDFCRTNIVSKRSICEVNCVPDRKPVEIGKIKDQDNIEWTQFQCL